MKALEERGIGRPSTYASIMETIQDRELRVEEGPGARADRRTPSPSCKLLEEPLHRPRRLRLHRPHGGRPRRDRRRPPGARAVARTSSGSATARPGSARCKQQALDEADPAEINARRRLRRRRRPRRAAQRQVRAVPRARRRDPGRSPTTSRSTSSPSTGCRELLAAPKGDEPIGTDPGDRPARVRQERPLRSLRAARHRRRAAAGRDEAEDGVAVQGHGPRHDHRRRRPPAAVAAPGRRRPPRRRRRSSPPTAATGRSSSGATRPAASTPSAQLFTVTLDEAVAILAQPKTYGRRQAAPAAAAPGVRPRPGVRAARSC